MSDQLKLGVVQMGAIEKDLDATLAKAEAMVASACEQGADLVVLPEFFNREYFCQYHDAAGYASYAEDSDGPTMTAVRRWARDLSTPVIAGVYERERPGLLFDSAIFVDENGEDVATYRKTHPSAVRSLEKIYFRGGSEFPVVELAGWNVGVVICYDVCFPEAARSVALNGADLIVAPHAAWVDPLWDSLFRVRAFENQVYVAGVNKVGREGDWEMQGRSIVCDPRGEIVSACSSDEDEVQIAVLDKSVIDAARTEVPLYRDRQPHLYGRLTRA